MHCAIVSSPRPVKLPEAVQGDPAHFADLPLAEDAREAEQFLLKRRPFACVVRDGSKHDFRRVTKVTYRYADDSQIKQAIENVRRVCRPAGEHPSYK